jgi:signal peptidase I
MSSDEIVTAPQAAVEPPPALPSGPAEASQSPIALFGHVATTEGASPSTADRIETQPLEAPAPALPAPRVRTWRPPALSAPGDDATRMRRALERRERDRRRRLLGVIWTTVKISVVVFITYGLIFNFSIVRGSSMSPGIHDGDRILVDHLSFLFRDVHRGDIVVLQYPLDPSLDYIKRVIGLPGDKIKIDGEGVWVNGVKLDEPYIAEPDPRSHLVQTVAPDCYFVLGDNRPHSSDSREFGQVPKANLVGLVNLRIWPPARAGILN